MIQVATMLTDYEAFRDNSTPWVTIDCETTIEAGSPAALDGAKMVMWGVRHSVGAVSKTNDTVWLPKFENKVVLVGHNLKFEFHHAFKQKGTDAVFRWLRENVCGIIDTQVAEYIVSGHSTRFPALSALCAKYGVAHSTKDEIHREYFSKGLGADHVPENKLWAYLKDDLNTTYEVAKIIRSQPEWHSGVMFVQGWMVPVLAAMEYTGLWFDSDRVRIMHDELSADAERMEKLIRAWTMASLPSLTPKGHEDLKLSPRTFSTLFFGEPGIPYKRPVVVSKTKTGRPKTKTQEFRAKSAAPVLVYPHPGVKPTEVHGFPITDDILEYIEGLEHNTGMPDEGKALARMAGIIRGWRGKDKLIGTYLKPILGLDAAQKLTRTESGSVICVHPQYNQTVTSTGRLSSSNPNAQNMPPEIKAAVRAPYVVNVDFKQLELWAAGVVSGDEVLLNDVATSDVHYEVGKGVYGWKTPADMGKDERRAIKGVNFGTIYGGGPKTISKQTGVPILTVEDIQNSFKARYRGLARAHMEWRNLASTGVIVRSEWDDVTTRTENVRMAPSPLGHRYFTFKEKEPPWGGPPSIVPSEAVNYPVQSFATGDVVPLFLVTMQIYGSVPGALLFSSIHDSASWYTGTEDQAAGLVSKCHQAVAEIPMLCSYLYGVTCKVPVELEVAVESHWA